MSDYQGSYNMLAVLKAIWVACQPLTIIATSTVHKLSTDT